MTNFFYIILIVIHCGIIAQSQTCCSGGAPLSSFFDIVNSGQKGFSIGINYEYNSVNKLVDNNQRLVNDPRSRNGQNYILRLDYAHNSKWAYSMFIPWVIQNRSTFSENESANGLGDLTVMGQFSSTILQEILLKFSLGIKLPTGNQYIVDDRLINLSPDMQSGSGTIDFFSRFAIAKNHLIIRNLGNQTSISYRLNTTNLHFGDTDKKNGRQFKFGDEILISSIFNYLMVINQWFISPDFGFQLRYATPNKEEGTTASNSGGYWFKIPLGIQFQPNKKYSFRIFGELPIFEKLEGLQITTDYKIGLQFRYQLQFIKNTDI